MLTKLALPGQTISGISLGGIYTALAVPELDALFDVGVAPRSFSGVSNLFLSHGHADHVGALHSMIGVRGLSRLPAPRTFLPVEIAEDIREGLEAFNRGQRRKIEVDYVPVAPGDTFELHGDLRVRAYRTLHSVPSLGFELYRKVKKLRPEFHSLGKEEIIARKRAEEDIFEWVERSELSYFTDTLIDVLDKNPSLYSSKTLILECTFLDDRKGKDEARKKSHVHLDEILERSELFQNENLVLMHFSQIYQPAEIHQILKNRLGPHLRKRVKVLAPQKGPWPG